MGDSSRTAALDAEVDRFVERMNAGGFDRRPAAEVVASLRVGAIDDMGNVAWRIQPVAAAPWFDAVQNALPVRLPPAFCSLAMRYAYLAFDVGEVRLCANTGTDRWDELGAVIVRDPLLANALRAGGFVHFARIRGGGYDPICFDLRRRSASGDCPIVRVDHEAALIEGRARAVATLADSFLGLIRQHAP